MDFIQEINVKIGEVERLKAQIELLLANLDKATEKTSDFLGKCAAVGYDRVSIGKKHKSIPYTESWPFEFNGSVFAFASGREYKTQPQQDRWPAIWGIVGDCGYGGGAGNSHQYQLNSAARNELIDGVYHLRKGKWIKVE